MLNLIDPIFDIHQSAHAAGVTLPKINMLMHREAVVPGVADRVDTGYGNARFFTGNMVVQVALIAGPLGMMLTRQAGRVASSFTNLANMPDDLDAGAIVNPDGSMTLGEFREPGQLYTTGRTLLVSHEDGYSRVIRAAESFSPTLLFSVPGSGRREVAFVVDVGPVVRRVHAALAALA